MKNLLKFILVAIAALFVVSLVIKTVQFAVGVAIIGGIVYLGYRFFANKTE